MRALFLREWPPFECPSSSAVPSYDVSKVFDLLRTGPAAIMEEAADGDSKLKEDDG
jgi:hypothetical protein